MVRRFLRNNPKLGFYGVFSWAFILDELNENATRLILRTRARGGRLFMLLNFLLFPPADFLVARLMLRTIKQRAERQAFVRSSSSEERPPAASAAGEPIGSGKVKR